MLNFVIVKKGVWDIGDIVQWKQIGTINQFHASVPFLYPRKCTNNKFTEFRRIWTCNSWPALTHTPMLHCHTTSKRQETSGFLTFSGGMAMEHWLKIVSVGQEFHVYMRLISVNNVARSKLINRKVNFLSTRLE